MNKTLYISDLDGTLLDNESRVSRRSAEIISELSHRGALISVATARTPATVVPLLSETFTTPPFIVMTGAALWSRGNDCFIPPVATLAADDFLLSYVILEELGIRPFTYFVNSDGRTLDVYHATAMNSAERDFYEPRKNLTLKRFRLGEEIPASKIDNCALLFATGNRREIEEAAEAIRHRSECSVSVYGDIFNPDQGLVEIFAPGVSKANAVAELKKRAGADRLVVFGDNLNDLSMMEIADVSVAVENGVEEVRRRADIVIGSNSEDAVARFIEFDFLK